MPTAAPAELGVIEDVGSWRLVQYKDDPSCTLQRLYEENGNTYLYVSYSVPLNEAVVEVYRSDWHSIKAGQDHLIDLHLGDKEYTQVKATGVAVMNTVGYRASFEAIEFLAALASANRLVISENDILMSRLDLGDTMDVALRLIKCAGQRNKEVRAGKL